MGLSQHNITIRRTFTLLLHHHMERLYVRSSGKEDAQRNSHKGWWNKTRQALYLHLDSCSRKRVETKDDLEEIRCGMFRLGQATE